jgi:hypothetical protein
MIWLIESNLNGEWTPTHGPFLNAGEAEQYLADHSRQLSGEERRVRAYQKTEYP